jgi:hypothetical protein
MVPSNVVVGDFGRFSASLMILPADQPTFHGFPAIGGTNITGDLAARGLLKIKTE